MYVWQSNVERERGPLFKSLFPHSCSVRVPGHVSLSQERIVEPAATVVSISCQIEHTRAAMVGLMLDENARVWTRRRTSRARARRAGAAPPLTHRDRD